MIRDKIQCIDEGSEFCPCHLAESNECIVCSQLQGNKFCDCCNWSGVCIYQGFHDNGERPKEGRKTFVCNVTESECYEDVILIKFEAPHKLVIDLSKPGSFVFIKSEENIYYDVPISVMDADIDNNIISIMVEIRGIKTKKLKDTIKKGSIAIRGPYWNGVFGVKNITSLKDSNVIVLARGIGMAPVIPVLKKLISNNNNITFLLDKAPFNKIYVQSYLDNLNIKIEEKNLIDKGKLSCEVKALVKEKVENEKIELIHIAGADILTYNIIKYLDELKRDDINLSCCNNFKMCCGEGICGACTIRFSGHRVKRFCKLQTTPRNVFEGRRFI